MAYFCSQRITASSPSIVIRLVNTNGLPFRSCQQLPRELNPQMGPVTSIMGEIMLVALTSDGRASPMEVREIADFTVRPQLLALSGVAQAIPIGGEVRQYRVTPNVATMQALEVTHEQIEQAITRFGTNTGGGFVDQSGREYLIRNVGLTKRLEDLANTVVVSRSNQPILLKQVATIEFAPRVKRGDAGYRGEPAVIIGVLKQPNADTVGLTRRIEAALNEIQKTLPVGVSATNIQFRQATFIETSIGNVQRVLLEAAVVVAIVLFVFLVNVRATAISLAAIPISILITVLVFRAFDLTINTMTLGGLAIAIGELVDDAVVGVENILRRLRQNRSLPHPRPVVEVVAAASQEVRSGIIYATMVIVLVFVPLFALSGIEGRLFAPLGVAYIVSIFASLVTSITVTPVLAYYLLSEGGRAHEGDSFVVRNLKRGNAALLQWAFDRRTAIFSSVAAAVTVAAVAAYLMPRSFLPPFNEGTLLVTIQYNPGISLAESHRLGFIAERIVAQVPEVRSVGRRTGRAELDEHAEGVHNSELDVDIERSARSKEEVYAEIRSQLSILPISINIGQPIAHRLDHMLSGVRAQIALKIYGEDLDTLRRLAETMRERLAAVAGLVDLQIEKQVLIPQVRIHLDYERAALYGMTPAAVSQALETMSNGRRVSQIVEGNRRFDVVMRLADQDRSTTGLANLLIATPSGHVPLSMLAEIEEGDGPNQVQREIAAAHCRVWKRRRAPRHGRDHRRHTPCRGRDELAAGLHHAARRNVPGAGRGGTADRRAVTAVARAHLHRSLQPLQFDRARPDHHGEHTACPDRQRHRALDCGPAALDRIDDRLHHARGNLRPQRHSQDIPLHQPGVARRRTVRPRADRSRLAGAPDAGADDGVGRRTCPDPPALRRRRSWPGNPAPRRGDDFRRSAQCDRARYAADAALVPGIRPQTARTPD